MQPMKIKNNSNICIFVKYSHNIELFFEVFVSILFGTSNSISLNLMLPKLKFNILPNDHKWLWHSQGLLNNPESVAIGGIKLKLK